MPGLEFTGASEVNMVVFVPTHQQFNSILLFNTRLSITA